MTRRPRARPGARRLRLLGASLVLAVAGPAAAQVPPHAAWREFETEHFVVVYPEGLDGLARRAAARAEALHGRLSVEFVRAPRGRIHLVVADNIDFAQGLASVFPWNRVVLYVAPAITNAEIEFTDDWLAMGLAHELAHVFHLDYASGLPAASRKVLGRSLLGFPALFQPTWVKEGLAIYYESSLTGAGRLHGHYHSMLLRSAAIDGTLRPIDDANGLSPWWPAGRTPYAYGSRFLTWFADADGGRALGAFVREASGNVWGLGLDGDAEKAFGEGFKNGWRAWTAHLREDARAAAAAVRATRAAEDGEIASRRTGTTIAGPAYSVARPRFDPAGERIAVELYDGKSDRVTRIVSLADGAAVERRRNSPGSHAWTLDGRILVYNQMEFAGRYTVQQDLFALDVGDGAETRLTRRARLQMADRAADGRWVAVETVPGTTRLVRLERTDAGDWIAEPLTEADPDVQWIDPVWSPDGRRLAAARWERGGFLDIVLLDDEGRLERRLTHDRAVDATPAWSPDGRYVLWASDRGGIRNLWAYDLAAGADAVATYRVTDETGGAFDPNVSPDGRRLAYVAHTGHGFVLRVVEYDPAAWTPAPLPPGADDPVPDPYPDAAGGPSRPYSPLRSLRPTSWLPLWTGSNAEQGAFLGALLAGADVVGRHAYLAFATVSTRTADVEAAFAYTYSGLGNPDLGLVLEQDWDRFAVALTDTTATEILERERRIAFGPTWVWPRFRHFEALSAAVELRRFQRVASDPAAGLAGLRPLFTEYGADLRFQASSARAYAYSISAERGWRASLRARGFRLAEDPDLWFASLRGRLRGYLPIDGFGFARHVVAVQAAGAASVYDGRPEIFSLGGVPGTFESLFPGFALGDEAEFPVRGFAEGQAAGDRVAATSLEYRFPLALFGRGLGLAPLYFDRLSAALFIDGGAAWAPGDGCRRTLASAGAEVALDLVLSHALPYRVRGGIARRLDAPAGVPRGWQAYAAVGAAF